MLKFPFRRILAFLCLVLNYSFAQGILEEVTVSALKLPQKERDIARDMTILTDSVIQRFQGLGLSELLSRQTGMQIIGTGQTPGSIKTSYLRGSSASQVLILLDGVPVYEPSAIGNGFDLNLINLNAVERVEILRGGNSTLYGSEAMAGVINIITRKGQAGVFRPSAQVNAGSFGQISGNLNLSGTASKGFSYSLGGLYESSRGISSASIEAGEAEKDAYQNRQMEARIGQKLGDWNLQLFGNLKAYDSDLDAGAFIDETDFTFGSRSGQFGGGVQYQGQKSNANIQFSQLYLQRDYLNDSLHVTPVAFDLFSESKYGSSQSFADAYWGFKPVSQIDLLIGADYRGQSMNQSYYSVSAYGEYRDPDITRDDAAIRNTSIYTSVQSLWADVFGFDLGGRLNNHSVYGWNSSFQVNPYLKLGKEIVFINVASSYRNPALYELFSPYGNRDLSPEKGMSYELGWKRGTTGKLAYNLTIFSRSTYDLISFQNLSEPPFGRYINLGKERVNGADASLRANLGSIHASVNYTFLTGYVYADGEGFNKTDLLRKPKHLVNAGIDKTFGTRWSAGLHGRFTGKRIDRYYDSAVFEQKEMSLNPYVLLNVSAQYKMTEKFSAQIFVNNLLNADYQEIAGYSTRPLNFNLGLIYR